MSEHQKNNFSQIYLFLTIELESGFDRGESIFTVFERPNGLCFKQIKNINLINPLIFQENIMWQNFSLIIESTFSFIKFL